MTFYKAISYRNKWRSNGKVGHMRTRMPSHLGGFGVLFCGLEKLKFWNSGCRFFLN